MARGAAMMHLTASELANFREQTAKPTIGISKTQVCPICRKTRSIAQFFNKSKLPTLKFCGVCREKIKLQRLINRKLAARGHK
jgi:hypothetical protein